MAYKFQQMCIIKGTTNDLDFMNAAPNNIPSIKMIAITARE